jgi:hypothetical protein
VARQPADGRGQAPPGLRLVVAHLLSGLAALDDRFARRWEPCSLETFLVTVTSPGVGGVAARWRVDLGTRTVTSAAGVPAGEPAGGQWEVVGPIDLWAQVVEGETSLGMAHRRGMLRYWDAGDPTTAMLNRLAMLAELLGIARWHRTQPLRSGEERPQERGSPRPEPARTALAEIAARPLHTSRPVPASATLPANATVPASALAPANATVPANAPVPASGPVRWPANPRAGLTNMAASARGTAQAARRRAAPPRRSRVPAHEGHAESGPGVAECAGPRDDDARRAWLTRGVRDAGARRQW